MTKDEIKAFLKEKPGYLKEGAARLSEKLSCSVETCRHALTEARIDAKGSDFDLDNVSTSEISEFKQFLKDNEIEETDVKSVKFWQNMQFIYCMCAHVPQIRRSKNAKAASRDQGSP